MYVKPVVRHCWLSGLRRRPLRLLRASGHGEGRSGCFKTSFTFLFLSFEYTVIIRADYGNLVKEF